MNLIRNESLDNLRNKSFLEGLLLELGIGPPKNQSFILRAYPEYLMPFIGKNLHSYQNHKQFASYLIFLSDKKIESYIELGVCFGGTFIITIEYLKRFNNLTKKVAVDIKNWSNLLTEYSKYEDFDFLNCSSRQVKRDFYDLCFIDGDHKYEAVKKDYELFKSCKYIAFHDILYTKEGVCKLWRELEGIKYEFIEQYENHLKDSMGIGVLSNI